MVLLIPKQLRLLPSIAVPRVSTAAGMLFYGWRALNPSRQFVNNILNKQLLVLQGAGGGVGRSQQDQCFLMHGELRVTDREIQGQVIAPTVSPN